MNIKSYKKDGKNYYEVRVKRRLANGKQIERRKRDIPSAHKAERIYIELCKEIDGLVDTVPSWTWADWHRECISRMKLSLKMGTVVNYDSQVRKWIPKDFAKKDLKSITTADVHALVFDTIDDQISRNSLHGMLKKIRRIFEMAVEEGILGRNPAAGIKVTVPEADQRVLSAAEAEILLSAGKTCNHHFYPIWVVALNTGMRSGEMFALRWNNVDFESGMIHVKENWTSKDGFGPTKSRRGRVVPMNDAFKSFVWGLWTTRKSATDFVLPRLREWEGGMQAEELRKFCEALGITSVKFHDLRATFITNLLMQGVPLVVVMSMVGHSKMSTTDRYMRLAGVNVKGGTDNIGYSIPTAEAAKVVNLSDVRPVPVGLGNSGIVEGSSSNSARETNIVSLSRP